MVPCAHYSGGRNSVHWAAELVPPDCGFSAVELAGAVASAMDVSQREWIAECALFRPGVLPPSIPVDWPECAWEDPWCAAADPRSAFLDASAAVDCGSADFAIFGDGSVLPSAAASYCAQACSFGSPEQYWESGSWVSPQVSARLPLRFGLGSATIHTAELVSLLVGLRWCRPASL